jgi:SAM-dependent methyltransferase
MAHPPGDSRAPGLTNVRCQDRIPLPLCQAGWVSSTPLSRRRSLWDYYDRRAPDYDGSVSGTQRYFAGFGVDADPNLIRVEREQLSHLLTHLKPTSFVDIGAGPGVFTGLLPGRGFAIDQSESALHRLRGTTAGVPVVRGDSSALPLADKAVGRIFAGHLYGHLEEDERLVFLAESRRVAGELVILDSGRPPGAKAQEWQTRGLADGTSYTVYKRHFNVDELLAEVGGEPLFCGSYYILLRSIAGEHAPPRRT